MLGCGAGITLIIASLMVYNSRHYSDNKLLKFNNVVGIVIVNIDNIIIIIL